jgi:hypothetical protein
MASVRVIVLTIRTVFKHNSRSGRSIMVLGPDTGTGFFRVPKNDADFSITVHLIDLKLWECIL